MARPNDITAPNDHALYISVDLVPAEVTIAADDRSDMVSIQLNDGKDVAQAWAAGIELDRLIDGLITARDHRKQR